MLTKLIEQTYQFLWGDLVVLPIGEGFGLSLMVVVLLVAGVYFTCKTRLLPVRLFRDMLAGNTPGRRASRRTAGRAVCISAPAWTQ